MAWCNLNGRAGVLPIEFIERSRNESLGIEWLFAAYCAVQCETTAPEPQAAVQLFPQPLDSEEAR